MFFNQNLMIDGSLKDAWRIAHGDNIREEDNETPLPEICEQLQSRIDHEYTDRRRCLSLRSAGFLTSGVLRLYRRKAQKAYEDLFQVNTDISLTSDESEDENENDRIKRETSLLSLRKRRRPTTSDERETIRLYITDEDRSSHSSPKIRSRGSLSNDTNQLSEIANNHNDISPTNGDEEIVDNDRELVDNDEEVVNDDEEVVDDNEKVVGDNKDVVGNDEEVVGDDGEVVGDNKEVVGDDEEVVDDDEEVVGDNEEVVGDDEEVVDDDEEVVGDNEEVVGDDEKVVDDDEEVVGDDKEVVDDDEEVVGDDEEAVDDEAAPSDGNVADNSNVSSSIRSEKSFLLPTNRIVPKNLSQQNNAELKCIENDSHVDDKRVEGADSNNKSPMATDDVVQLTTIRNNDEEVSACRQSTDGHDGAARTDNDQPTGTAQKKQESEMTQTISSRLNRLRGEIIVDSEGVNFSTDLPFGCLYVYDSYSSRVPTKIILSSLNEDIRKLK